MGNIIVDTGSFFFSLLAGDLFSNIASPTERLKKILANKELFKLLDEYHRWFLCKHDSEISLFNSDMTVMKVKRKDLLDSFDRHFLKSRTDIDVNRKEQFLQETYQIVDSRGVVSEIEKIYLDGFLQVVQSKKTDISIVLNYLSDQIHDELYDHDRRISENKNEIERLKTEKERLTRTPEEKNDQSSAYDFSEYYDYIKKKFKRKKRRGTESFVGNESDEKAYIDAFLTYQDTQMPVLRYLEQWFDEEDFGTILIHGEPGHGKTTLCNKAVFDYTEGKFLSEDKNVIAVSLNTGANTTIIENGYLHLENALVWGGDRHTFTFKDCRGALLFMDSFDEFIDEARKVGITDIVSFLKIVDEIAEEYDIHIVVMSRTTAVKGYLKKPAIVDRSFQLLPVTEEQQDDWLGCHNEYDDFKETFNNLRKNENMYELLGIPLLFRLIVHNRFDKVSSNLVELYDNLFDYLMEKRGICDDRLVSVRKGLTDLAYNIYCTDTDLAVMQKKELDKDWVFAFYITISGIEQGGVRQDYKVGFYHRSFYQFFLAKFIYLNLLGVTSENAEEFIGYFAERELDSEVREYLSLMLNETDKERIDSRMNKVISALVETEAFCNLIPKHSYGNAERSRIGRCTIVYRNVMHIAYALSYVIQTPFKDGLDILSRTFQSNGIKIFSDDHKKADLNEANLSGANLSLANLSGANLRRANLSEANLSLANLSGANLRRANLSEANLSGAYLIAADLSEANLSFANLIIAKLNEADLSGADLRKAYLTGAKLNVADLREANLSGTYLIAADLSEANLSLANLSGADLRGAKLDMNINSVKSLSDSIIYTEYKNLISSNIDGYDSINWIQTPSF